MCQVLVTDPKYPAVKKPEKCLHGDYTLIWLAGKTHSALVINAKEKNKAGKGTGNTTGLLF